MSRVSIVVPIYNVELYLDKCVKSLLLQTFNDIEIILVNDGSSDGCPELCDAYAASDSRVKVIHQTNQGVSVARNVGMDMATGEWIMFCDPDDWYELDAVEMMVSHVEKYGSDMAIFGYIMHFTTYSRTFPAAEKEYILNEEDKIRACKNKMTWRLTCNEKIYRKCFIDYHNIRFTPGSVITQDLMFSLKTLHAANQVSCGSVCLYHNRILEGSASHRYRPDVYIHYTKILDELRFFVDEKFDKKTGNRIYLIFGYYLFCAGLKMTCMNQSSPQSFRQRLEGIQTISSVEPWASIINQVSALTLKDQVKSYFLKKQWILLYYLSISCWSQLKCIIKK